MAPLVFGFRMASAGSSLAIDSTTSSAVVDNVGVATATPASIPAGAVVVAFMGVDHQGDANDPVVSSTNLTWAKRAVAKTGSNFTAAIFTAVAGSTLSNEAISTSQAGFPRAAAITVVVLTGANTTALTNTNTGIDTVNHTPFSLSLTANGSNSYVFSCFWALDGWTGAASVTPDAGITEIQDAGNATRGNSFWVGHNTAMGSGAIAISGNTLNSNRTALVQVSIEIQSA